LMIYVERDPYVLYKYYPSSPWSCFNLLRKERKQDPTNNTF
jgi:hypothetical protein